MTALNAPAGTTVVFMGSVGPGGADTCPLDLPVCKELPHAFELGRVLSEGPRTVLTRGVPTGAAGRRLRAQAVWTDGSTSGLSDVVSDVIAP